MKKIIATLLVSVSIASPFAAQAQAPVAPAATLLGASIPTVVISLVAAAAVIGAVQTTSNH
jgi:lipopolysaccharide export LptBFGC system permease protein LptF